MATQDFIPVTNSPNNQYLAQDYATTGPSPNNDVVTSDLTDTTIQPVIENPQGSNPPFTEDYLDTDSLSMGIGNFGQAPTGGVFSMQVGAVTAGLADLSGTITAAALTTALNAALTTEVKPLCLVTEIADGVYQIAAVSNGAITAGFFQVIDFASLFPLSTGVISEGTLGSASTRYAVLLTLAQQAMCYADLPDEIAPADVSITTVQAGSGTANKIQNIAFSYGAYGGSATISANANGVDATCGTITPGMTAFQIGTVLATHPEIEFANFDGTPDNIAVTQISLNNWNVEFIGTLANNNSNALSVSNSAVIGPMGKSGKINYNTFALNEYAAMQPGSSFPLTRQIQRTRASGETRVIYSSPVTVQKSFLNPNTAVPTPPASYFTSAQVTTLLAGKQDLDATLTSLSGRSETGVGSIVYNSGPTITGAKVSNSTTVLTSDGAIALNSGTVFLEKGSAAAMTIAAPSGQDGMTICIMGNTDFAHVVTFTGSTLLDGTIGANLTATFAAFAGSSITIQARGAFWLVQSLNLVVCVP